MFESLVYVRKEKALARGLLTLPLALAAQASLAAALFLYSLLAKEVLAPPERAWAALLAQAPRITLLGGAVAPKPRGPEPAPPNSPRDDRLRPPAQTPAEIPPANRDAAPAGPEPDGPVVDGALPRDGADGPPLLPLPKEPPPRPVLRVGASVRPPVLLQQVPPVYPPAARAMGLSGRVVLEVVVDEEGLVQEVRVLSASHPLFVEAAVEAVRRWRYSRPVDVSGQRVACAMPVTVIFSLS